MNASTLTLLSITLSAGAAFAAPIKELSVKPFNRIWSELSSDRRSVKIMAESVYPNKCLMDKELFKSKQVQDNQIHYRLYRQSQDDRNCIKIYQPSGRIHSVDEISLEDLNKLDLVTVNGMPLPLE